MDFFEKIEKWFQVATATLIVLFSNFNLIRVLVYQSGIVYAISFAIMSILSWYLLKLAWGELKDAKVKCEEGEL